MEFAEKTLNSKQVYDGKIVKVYRDDVELSDGKKSFREVVRHSGGVVVLAVKANESEDWRSRGLEVWQFKEERRAGCQEGKLFNNSSIDEIPQKPINDTDLSPCGFADGRNEVSPDSEQMELTGTQCRKRHSVSVEQIQDNSLIALSPQKSYTSIPPYPHTSILFVRLPEM